MLETVTPQSLVLLDELGRATDPDRWLHGMNKLQRHVEELS